MHDLLLLDLSLFFLLMYSLSLSRPLILSSLYWLSSLSLQAYPFNILRLFVCLQASGICSLVALLFVILPPKKKKLLILKKGMVYIIVSRRAHVQSKEKAKKCCRSCMTWHLLLCNNRTRKLHLQALLNIRVYIDDPNC